MVEELCGFACPVTVDMSVTLLCARAKVVGTTRSFVVQLYYVHL